MFLCEKCAKQSGATEFQMLVAGQSRGPCEGCSKITGCLDIPSRSLPGPEEKAEEASEEKS